MSRGVAVEVARRLVAAQFREWAELPLAAVELDGWDNTTFRLGERLSVRLPNDDAYAAQVEKEHRWLPLLAPELPLLVPEPVALGSPTPEFPRPWSIRRWIDGTPAATSPEIDRRDLAVRLAGFLRALYEIDASAGPVAGRHSFFRGGPLDVYDAATRSAMHEVADHIDVDAVTATWAAALATRWEGPGVWVHGDVAPSNLLVRSGELAAVIDFGCAAVGDPACDLVMAWTFFDRDEREAFRRELRLDDATWERARGWALWKTLLVLADDGEGGATSPGAVARWGWRRQPRALLDELVS